MTHTPGPWRISEGVHGQLDIVRPWDATVRAGDEPTFGDYRGAIVAHVSFVGNDAVPTQTRAMENARLIAAAPEMLAALRQCADEIRAALADIRTVTIGDNLDEYHVIDDRAIAPLQQAEAAARALLPD